MISGVAERYARSLFDLALESNSVEAVGRDLADVETMLANSPELTRLIESPVFSADDQFRAISAVASRAGIGGLVGNFLKVAAKNRRLFAVPGMIRSYRQIAAAHRGEVAAEVTSAHELDAQQQEQLRTALREVARKDVAVSVTVDPSLLGGLVVKIGSRQIDTSLRTKLNSLKLALKEVG